ncbi:AGAP012840-PA [Anopheles gambiae str. PEST]|uniref:AGAP012840-PA n=1 Tax=Anopheles gambiae TaxID=7165 RepID=A0NAQ1_ANOGA|nr:AGAP012840-PA [Anopheles gambiae str. PEST]
MRKNIRNLGVRRQSVGIEQPVFGHIKPIDSFCFERVDKRLERSDNAAAYGIAQQMQGNVSGQSAVNDGLSFAAQTVSSTSTAVNQIISVLNSVQNAVTTLGNNQGSPAALDQIGTQITGLLQQIDTIARNATFNGVNLIAGSTTDGLGITANSLKYITGLQGDQTTVTGFNAAIASYMGGTSSAALRACPARSSRRALPAPASPTLSD